MPTSFLIRYRTPLTVGANLATAAAAYALAFALRFDLAIPASYRGILVATLPLLLAVKGVGFWTCGIFSGWWRHVSVRDAEEIVHGNLAASVMFLTGLVFLHGLAGFPRAVLLLDLMACTSLMLGIRVTIRLVRERRAHPEVRRIDTLTLIVGAGSAGIRLLDEIENRPRLRTGVVGFVDDDPSKLGLRISGKPVLGRVDDLVEVVARHEIAEVLIAIPSASGVAIRRIAQRCVAAGIRHRVLPALGELVEGRVMYTQMRDVKVDDLLAREPVHLDVVSVRSLMAHQTVLVTGAAGSIGSELCRQLAAHEPDSLVLYDRHENGMFALELELRNRFPRIHLVPILGDVLLEDQLRSVFDAHRPAVVFHAAAYKHVPIAEQNVLEAVRNNILGTRNVAQAAIAHGVREFVLVSTDKAVRPASVMGVTKRVAEMVVQSMPNAGCAFMAVRFGNVLGSNGSVVPIFREQIARGGPVTVTHPDATRFFMTIPEAAQLILQAAAFGRGGEICLLEMGEPIRIVDLARNMIRLSGFEPDLDVAIAFTGLRPGEKLHEELMAEGEEVTAIYHDRIRVLRANAVPARAGAWIAALGNAVEAADVPGTVRLLRQLVPSYRPSPFLCAQMDGADRSTVERPNGPAVVKVA
jgi:FlaA1/EpsC-like NDP-sugar epimerase